MGLSESIQDLVGKYSVTGVLKERLDLELARAAASREDATKQIAALSTENASLVCIGFLLLVCSAGETAPARVGMKGLVIAHHGLAGFDRRSGH